jgi:hypothetical protein
MSHGDGRIDFAGFPNRPSMPFQQLPAPDGIRYFVQIVQIKISWLPAPDGIRYSVSE